MTLGYRTLTGEGVNKALEDLAQLRITVFRDWPYLYDGDVDYERRYMASYRDNPDAILVAAFDQERIVGASTGTPMEDHASDFADAFAGTGIPLDQIFYCAESVLLSSHRGQGAGHAFFDAREAHAKKLGRKYSAFCAVQRSADHPLRPDSYRALDVFWQKRGYDLLEGVTASFAWKDIDEPRQTRKSLQFWMKHL